MSQSITLSKLELALRRQLFFKALEDAVAEVGGNPKMVVKYWSSLSGRTIFDHMIANSLAVCSVKARVEQLVEDMRGHYHALQPLLESSMVFRDEAAEESLAEGVEFGDAFVNHDFARQLYGALTHHGETDLADRLKKEALITPKRQAYVKAAHDALRDEDHSMDDNPPVAPGEGGANVVVWHWVSDDDLVKDEDVP